MTEPTATEQSLPLPMLAGDAPIDLAGCSVCTIAIGTLEHDKVESPRLERWPYIVRSKIEQAMSEWIAAHPDRMVRLYSSGIGKACCFVMLHHVAKS